MQPQVAAGVWIGGLEEVGRSIARGMECIKMGVLKWAEGGAREGYYQHSSPALEQQKLLQC